MAASPTISFIQPTDPGSYAAAIQLQRQQQIADALLAQSQQPLSADLPQNLRIVPKMGWQGGMIKLGQALMANKLESNVDKMRAAAAQQQWDRTAPMFQSQPSASPMTPLQAGQMAMASGAQAGQPGPTNAAAAAQSNVLAAQPPQAPPTPGPMAIPGMDPSVAQRLFYSNPEEYWKALAAARAPTTEQKNWSAQGVDPRQLAGGTVLAGQRQGMTDMEKLQAARAAAPNGSPQAAQLDDAISKANYLAPIDAKPGTPVLDPRTGKPTFFAPKVADGVGLQFGSDPLHPSAYPLPGYAGANASIVGADQRARTDNSVYQATGPGGEPLTIRGAAVPGGGAPAAVQGAGAAPALRQPGAPGAAAPRPIGLAGPSSTDALIQKSGAEAIGTAPAQLAASKQSITGLESALRVLGDVRATGPGTLDSQHVTALLNNFGVPLGKTNNDNYQLLQKYLSNSLNAAANGSSAGGSDARFESFMHGQPNADAMDKVPLEGAIRYVLSQHDAAAARADFLPKAYNTAKAAGDPNAALTAQQQWAHLYDPQVFAFSRMSPADQAQFKASLSPQQQQAFGQHYNGMYAQGWVK